MSARYATTFHVIALKIFTKHENVAMTDVAVFSKAASYYLKRAVSAEDWTTPQDSRDKEPVMQNLDQVTRKVIHGLPTATATGTFSN